MNHAPRPDLPQRLRELEGQIQELERNAGPEMRARAQEMLRTVLDFHGTALDQLLKLILQAGEPGRRILDSAAQNDLVRSLLLLHGLHTLDPETRVRQALDQVRPFLHSQGAEVELVAIAEHAVRLRLVQGDGRYPATRQTLQAAVEEAICTAAPDVCHIEFIDEQIARFPLPVLTAREP